ncbi:hypothetical protein [Chitinimonas sp. BJYL2]|uniref:hypothetical protein n=1 Tax=Chitinimonas sp. BJYL2 TaxID=2976696 RepID=UPI0022B4828D|nr:hypothetical protein [Chitinimonas sp. BJYL2]
MHALDLPTIDASLPLAFADARGFKDWLKLVPMINVRQAHAEILDVLNRLNQNPVLPIERLKMLELLREPVMLLQEENAKRYTGKALPLSDAENVIWKANVQLWREMSMGYRHCWRAAMQDDVSVADHKALTGQRALRYAALAIREHHQAYRTVPTARWNDLFGLYKLAVDAGHANKVVKDSLNRHSELSTGQSCFVQALLLAAANPSAMTVRQLAWADRLLDRWANRANVTETPPERLEGGLLAVDLANPGPLRRYDAAQEGEGWRYLEIDSVAKSLKKRIKYLRAGESPAKLGLGEEYAAATAEQYLASLYQEWCEPQVERGMPRHMMRDETHHAEVGLGLAGAHLGVAGEHFAEPAEHAEVRGRAIADFQLFGGQAQHLLNPNQPKAAEGGAKLEQWRVLNESALGFRLERGESGGRLTHSQLVAVQPRAGQPFMVGTVRWLHELDTGGIDMGIRALPGIPRAIAVRATGLNTFSNRFTQALALPAMPALKANASLLLPPTWFKPGRIVEVYVDGQIKRARLDELLERGADFERVAYQGDLF